MHGQRQIGRIDAAETAFVGPCRGLDRMCFASSRTAFDGLVDGRTGNAGIHNDGCFGTRLAVHKDALLQGAFWAAAAAAAAAGVSRVLFVLLGNAGKTLLVFNFLGKEGVIAITLVVIECTAVSAFAQQHIINIFFSLVALFPAQGAVEAAFGCGMLLLCISRRSSRVACGQCG